MSVRNSLNLRRKSLFCFLLRMSFFIFSNPANYVTTFRLSTLCTYIVVVCFLDTNDDIDENTEKKHK